MFDDLPDLQTRVNLTHCIQGPGSVGGAPVTRTLVEDAVKLELRNQSLGVGFDLFGVCHSVF